MRQNALSAADLNDLEYTFGTFNLVVSEANHSPPRTGVQSDKCDKMINKLAQSQQDT